MLKPSPTAVLTQLLKEKQEIHVHQENLLHPKCSRSKPAMSESSIYIPNTTPERKATYPSTSSTPATHQRSLSKPVMSEDSIYISNTTPQRKARNPCTSSKPATPQCSRRKPAVSEDSIYISNATPQRKSRNPCKSSTPAASQCSLSPPAACTTLQLIDAMSEDSIYMTPHHPETPSPRGIVKKKKVIKKTGQAQTTASGVQELIKEQIKTEKMKQELVSSLMDLLWMAGRL